MPTVLQSGDPKVKSHITLVARIMTPCTARKHCAQSSLLRASLSNNRKYDTARCLGGGGGSHVEKPAQTPCRSTRHHYSVVVKTFALLCFVVGAKVGATPTVLKSTSTFSQKSIFFAFSFLLLLSFSFSPAL